MGHGQVIPNGRCTVPGLEGPERLPVHGDMVILTEDLCKEYHMMELFSLSEKMATFAAELKPLIKESPLDLQGAARSAAILTRCTAELPDFSSDVLLDNRVNSVADRGPNNKRELTIYFFLNSQYSSLDGGALQVTCEAPDAQLASRALCKARTVLP